LSTRPTAADDRQLHLYIKINLVTVTAATIGLVVIRYTIARTNWMLVNALAVGTVVVALVVVQTLLRRGRLDSALTLLAAANWTVAMVVAALEPFVLPIVTIVLVVPVVVIVPFVRSRRLLATGLGAVAVSVASVVLAQLHLVNEPERLSPLWLQHATLLIFIPTLNGLLLLNVWRSHLSLAKQADEIRQSRSRIVAASDRERRRIERDLHDGAQQRLTSLAIRLGVAQDLTTKDPERAAHVLAQLQDELAESISELRDLAHGIYPPLLSQRGLEEAIKAAARRSTQHVTVRSVALGRYEAEVESAVYFCCLEALANASKHSGSTRVDIELDATNGLAFSITDDGCGFDPSRVLSRVGLVNMADRIGAIGGTLTIDAHVGTGTCVRGYCP
jgi:signal transduction histidine kinase